MTKKTFLARLFVTLAVVTFVHFVGVFSVMAAELTEDNIAVTYESNGRASVTVSAITDVKNRAVVLLVTNPGCTPYDIGDGDKDSIQNQTVVLTDDDGKFSYTFTVNADKNKNSGLYSIYYGLYPANQTKFGDFQILDSVDMNGFVTDFVALSENELYSFFIGDSDELTLQKFPPFKSVDKEKLAKNVKYTLGKVDIGEGTAYDAYNQLVGVVKSASVTEALNQNLKSVVTNENGEFIYEDEIGFKAFDAENKTTFVSCFHELISQSGQKKIIDGLFGMDFKDAESAYKKYAEMTVLYGLANPAKKGYGHVEKLLSEENIKYLDINLGGTLTTEKQKKIADRNADFKSLDELEKFVADIEEDEPSGSSRPSVGGGGLSHSVSADYNQQIKDVEPVGYVFGDVPETHWAAEAIANLKVKGIINGVDDTNFAPNGTVTREQFVKILCAASGVDIMDTAAVNTNQFSDVELNAWYAPYICTAYELGIVNGVSENTFGVGQDISRQDICTLICRALSLSNTAQTVTFTDSEEIAAYAKDAVETLASLGIITGYNDGSFKPRNECTRAEAAQIVYKIIKQGVAGNE